MSERMSTADVSFLYLEGRTTPQHVGGLAVFEAPADGFDYDRLVRLLEERISLVPRYRQKVRMVPGHIAAPVWVDDANFDITYHVRRSALPRPGSDGQLLEFAARILSRLLDRNRPLWEVYLIEGLVGGRVAVITKTHQALVDGVGAVDMTEVVLDDSPRPRRTVEALWMPEPEPSPAGLVMTALADLLHRPAALVDAARTGLDDALATVAHATGGALAAASSIVSLVRPAPPAPLSASLGEQRRIAVARTRLADYRAVRDAHGGTVNDVVLATVAGALRQWLVQRGVDVQATATLRALVPVSVAEAPGGVAPRTEDGEPGRAVAGEHAARDVAPGRLSGGVRSRVTGLVIDLPIGERDPLCRLARVSAAMATHQHSGRSVGADALAALGGFAPPTLHALGARAAHGLARRLFDVVITNVPGPQHPRYAAGARMIENFPVIPLNRGHALAIGVTSYDGGVYFGLNGDRDALPDIEAVAQATEAALAELVDHSAAHQLAPPVAGQPHGRGRRASRRAEEGDR